MGVLEMVPSNVKGGLRRGGGPPGREFMNNSREVRERIRRQETKAEFSGKVLSTGEERQDQLCNSLKSLAAAHRTEGSGPVSGGEVREVAGAGVQAEVGSAQMGG